MTAESMADLRLFDDQLGEARARSRGIPHHADRTSLSIQHTAAGYYLDVHAPDSPTGLPLACAVFPWVSW